MTAPFGCTYAPLALFWSQNHSLKGGQSESGHSVLLCNNVPNALISASYPLVLGLRPVYIGTMDKVLKVLVLVVALGTGHVTRPTESRIETTYHTEITR